MTVPVQFWLTHIHPKYQKQQYDLFCRGWWKYSPCYSIVVFILFCQSNHLFQCCSHPKCANLEEAWEMERRWDKNSGSHVSKLLQCSFLFALWRGVDWLLNFNMDQPGQIEPGSGLEAEQTQMCVCRWTKRVGVRQGGNARWGTPALVSWREERALAAGTVDVCVSAVGVCVGIGNGTAFWADLCSQT